MTPSERDFNLAFDPKFVFQVCVCVFVCVCVCVIGERQRTLDGWIKAGRQAGRHRQEGQATRQRMACSLCSDKAFLTHYSILTYAPTHSSSKTRPRANYYQKTPRTNQRIAPTD